MTVIDGVTGTRDVLTQVEAQARVSQVTDVAYELWLDLRAGEASYDGHATVSFTMLDRTEPLFLDFTGRVTSLSLDGAPIEVDQRGHRLFLPGDRLGERVVLDVTYRNAYDHSGAGFHRFVDPEDGAEYVHSDFEPFAAHRLFPCFDQPDLKATYTLTVDAPDAWTVVTATHAVATESLPDGRRRHRFPRTPRFSTYLFAVVAGPYAVQTTVHDGIAMAIFARRSMAAILEREADELFEITTQGLDLYRELFGQPYPFGKYDQLFVPEFNAGAMENVAAVTFHDAFLFRDPPTEAERLERGEVVLHELAHMWFGDLTTLRWWNDLWLNESFATWASFHALENGTRFTGAWKRFNGVMKPAAYRDDQRVTSHPIATPVPDTDAAQTNFDAIVYEKGASVLRQLMATIGDAAFAAGLRLYFERHAWGNATLADFLDALGTAAGRSLDAWAEGWIMTKGTDTVTTTWQEVDGRMQDLTVGVVAPDPFAPVRSHAMRLGIVHGTAPDIKVTTLPVLATGPRTEVAAVDGLMVPRLVYPNHGDFDYARVILDERSVRFALDAMGELGDPTLRQVLWSTLGDMVRESRLSSLDYLDAVARLLPGETDQEIADAVLEHAVGAIAAYVPEDLRGASASALIGQALDIVESHDGTDLRRTWLRAAVSAGPDAVGTHAVDWLLDLADREGEGGLPVDQEQRWSLAITASAAGRADAAERIEREAQRDRSDRGVRARITAEVARPDAAGKAEAWARINGDGYGSFQLTRAAMRGFQWQSQQALLEPFRERFFGELRTVFATHEYAFARAWLRMLYPGLWAEASMVERARALLAELGPEEATLARHLRETIDDQERMIRVRARAAQPAD